MLPSDTSVHTKSREESISKTLGDYDLRVDQASLQLANGEVDCIVEVYEMQHMTMRPQRPFLA
jgi:hypothetical protein